MPRPEIRILPALSDNTIHVIQAGGRALVVDPGEAAPVARHLQAEGLTLEAILLTHHHFDHIDGVADLVEAFGGRVIGAAADRHRLPPLDQAVAPGEVLTLLEGAARLTVHAVPGHTSGHIAFVLEDPETPALFSGDALFLLGCGRLSEGSAADLWPALQRLRDSLPGATEIYCGHEYTAANLRFALTVEPENPALLARQAPIQAAIAAGRPTQPGRMEEERAGNPFLRADQPSVKRGIGLEETADPVAVFARLRDAKNAFR